MSSSTDPASDPLLVPGPYLDALWHARADEPVLVDHSLERPAANLTGRAWADWHARAVHSLRAAGVGPGDIVAVQCPNRWEFVVLTYAVWHCGAVVAPIMPIFRGHEVREILDLVPARLYVAPRAFRGYDFGPVAAAVQAAHPGLTVWLAGTGGTDPPLAERWASAPAEPVPPAPVTPDTPAEIVFTSGTTGRPKGVVHSFRTLLTGLVQQPDMFHLGPDDVVYMPSPFAHQSGFLYGVLLPVVLGARAVYQDIWDADTAWTLIRTHGATFSMGATPFLADLLRQYRPERDAGHRLRLFLCAGAPVPRVLVERAQQELGVHVLSGWGMSENSLVTVVRPEDPLDKTVTTDGRPVPGMTCRVVDRHGRPLPPGVEGDLEARGVQTFLGYYNDPATTAAVLRPDGWLRTGDRAVLDADGYVRITGRALDMINRGGEKIPVAEVEELLHRHPAIQEAALVGMPDPRLGERACAVVVLKPGASLTFDALQEYFASCDLTRQFWPERLVVMDALPKTPSGKIQKFRLRADLKAAAEPAASPAGPPAAGGAR